jgi:hypothetical protein
MNSVLEDQTMLQLNMGSASTTDNSFRRLSLDETLRRTARVYKTGFLVFSQVSLLTIGLQTVVWSLLLLLLLPAFGIDDPSKFDGQDPQYLVDHMWAFYGLSGVFLLESLLVGAIGEGAMIRAVADIYLKRQPNVRTCLRVGVNKACTLLAASFLALVGLMVGFVLLFLPGLYLSVKWFVQKPAIIIEGTGAIASFGRSSELVSMSWCYVFCTATIAYFFMMLCQVVWSAVFAGGNDAGHTLFSVWGTFIAAVPAVVFMPVLAIMMTIMYINLRVEKEGLNADRLARDLGRSEGTSGDSVAATRTYSPLVNEDDEAAAQVSSV